MATHSSASQSAGGSTLPRGKACINCRKRKMRCDGIRPVCGQCIRSRREEDCEYGDGQGRTRTEILEENIARLENRIRELQNPEQESPSVMLHDPHSGQTQVQAQPSWWELEEPPASIAQELVNTFLPHAMEFGFFLYVPRFLHSAFLPLPPGDASRPIPALLSTVYLLGIHASGSEDLMAKEPIFLSCIRRQLSAALAITQQHPQKVIEVIQTEALITNYFFRNNRVTEGRYHANAAVTLSFSCGLHKVRSIHGPSHSSGSVQLPEPIDAVEEGDRMNGFWLVYMMDKVWAVVLGLSPAVTDDNQIDTPWPLESEGYAQGVLPAEQRSSQTVTRFLTEPYPENTTEGLSILAMKMKAGILFARASHLTARWRQADMTYAERTAFNSKFQDMDNRIQRFISMLLPVDHIAVIQNSETVVRSLLLSHTLAHVAMIRLHLSFAASDAGSRMKCLNAARSVSITLQKANAENLLFVNPLVGSLCLEVCQVLIRGITSVRGRSGRLSSNEPSEEALMTVLNHVSGVMYVLAGNCPWIRLQYTRIQEARAAIA